ncbi:MAG: NF038122 family metalloprotease [Acetobacteraceae bacterium]|nr:NF038122 family metalloprotease [Acetobacteraceae bacterium]
MTRFTSPLALAAAILVLGGAASPARAGLTFDFTFDSSINATNFGANVATLEADVIAVGNTFSSMFANNVTLNITVSAMTTQGFLAGSLATYNDAYTYADVRTALIDSASTAASITATNELPLTEPATTKSGLIAVSTAEEKALGLIPGKLAGLNGTFYIGSNIGSGQGWDFAGTSTPAANAYSFIDAAEHEISELMGRSTQLANGNFNYNTPIDLFRCTATGPGGSGVINMDPAATNVYFSTDGCATVAKYYNGPNGNGADIQDWASTAFADPYDAYGTPGVYAPLSLVDQEIMNDLGWQAAPEPTALACLLPAAFGLVAVRARRQRATSAEV